MVRRRRRGACARWTPVEMSVTALLPLPPSIHINIRYLREAMLSSAASPPPGTSPPADAVSESPTTPPDDDLEPSRHSPSPPLSDYSLTLLAILCAGSVETPVSAPRRLARRGAQESQPTQRHPSPEISIDTGSQSKYVPPVPNVSLEQFKRLKAGLLRQVSTNVARVQASPWEQRRAPSNFPDTLTLW